MPSARGGPGTLREAPRHALRHWTALSKIVRDAEELLLLADYDGTLTPIVATPEQARLSKTMQRVLQRVAACPGVRVGIVSGRSLRTVRRMVGVPGLLYVGNHGFEILGRGLRFTHPQAKRSLAVVRRIAGQLRKALGTVHGSRTEAKGISLSVHWRQVAGRDMLRFQRIVREVLRPWVAARRIRVTRGQCVIEVRPPVAWDKGRGIEWVVRRARHPKRLKVLYLGDDQTDEDAFRSVNRLRGVSIRIGARRRVTRARWRLVNPAEVHEWLRRVLDVRSSTATGRAATRRPR